MYHRKASRIRRQQARPKQEGSTILSLNDVKTRAGRTAKLQITKSKIRGSFLVSLCLSSALSQLPLAASLGQNSGKVAPSGTLLLPLTPKLDSGDLASPSAIAPLPKNTSAAKSSSNKTAKSFSSASSTTAAAKVLNEQLAVPKAKLNSAPASPVPPVEPVFSAEVNTSALNSETAKLDSDEPDLAKLEEANDNVLLKGTVQITADDTEYDQNKNTFLGTGNAVAMIAGQDAKLEADMILYDQNTEMLDARGNVKIIREGQVSTGSSFRFKVSKDEYLITNPDTEIQGTQVIARTGYGNKDGLRFRQGTMELEKPIIVSRNSFNGTLSSQQENFDRMLHPEAFASGKGNFVFKARKMVYEKYKESGNLTVFGGKVMFGKFGIPVGKLTATVGKDSQVLMPLTPFFGNNIMVGGINVGPQFNHMLPGGRAFSWAPLVQIGGRTDSAYDNDKKGSIGAGFRMAYRGKKLSGNLAYGSVSNLLVGDLKYIVNDHQQIQSGINRFLPNGLFGSQRARAIAEFVDTRGVGNIPFLQGVSFRSSAGWASDSPSLLNATPQYKALFTIQNGNITSGFRLQEQVMTSTHPFFAFGNDKVGVNMNAFGGVAGRAYSSGDSMLMGMVGPVLNVKLDRLRLTSSVMKSGVNGQSPFVFDQFIQGNKSGQLGGDIKLCKWLAVGGNLGYNIDNKAFYQKSISAAIGPDDFKLLVTHDTIRGINRFGFDLMYGQPIQFNKLVLKARPDQGQLGGI